MCSKTKKISIILSSIAITLGGVSLSSFAAGATAESLIEQTIGIPSGIGLSNEQEIDNSVNASKDFMNEEIIEDALPKVINLSTPGDYRLVGAEKGIPNNQDPNKIVVNFEDRIVITGTGRFNVILDNVNIDTNKDYRNGFLIIEKGANVKLILEGQNILRSNADNMGCGIYVDEVSKLEIAEGSNGSSLDILNLSNSIRGTNVSMSGGTINIAGAPKGYDYSYGHLFFEDFTMDGGTINSDSYLNGGNIVINGGKIDVLSSFVKNIIVNDGNIKTNALMINGNVEINGGTIDVNQISAEACHGNLFEMNGGTVKASKISAKNTIISGGELAIDSFNGKLWDPKKFEKVFGKFNSKDELIACSRTEIDSTCRPIYYSTLSEGSEKILDNNALITVTGGVVNGVGFKNDDDYRLKNDINNNAKSVKSNVGNKKKSIFNSLCDLNIYCFN